MKLGLVWVLEFDPGVGPGVGLEVGRGKCPGVGPGMGSGIGPGVGSVGQAVVAKGKEPKGRSLLLPAGFILNLVLV
jgi:hypothetical protein